MIHIYIDVERIQKYMIDKIKSVLNVSDLILSITNYNQYKYILIISNLIQYIDLAKIRTSSSFIVKILWKMLGGLLIFSWYPPNCDVTFKITFKFEIIIIDF